MPQPAFYDPFETGNQEDQGVIRRRLSPTAGWPALPTCGPDHRKAAANGHILMILGISVEQIIDHAATTSRVGREISFTFSSAGRRPAHLPALAGCPAAHVGQLDPLAILILFAGLYGCDS